MTIASNRNDLPFMRLIRCIALLPLAGLFGAALLLSSSCKDNPVVEDTNDHLELIRYIEVNEDGRSLFRTDGVVRDFPYSKGMRPGWVFRDNLDSVGRNYFTDIPSYFEVKDFGPPFGIIDDAEVEVLDVFYVRIVGDSAGVLSDTVYQQRVLRRWAYFLRFRSDRDAYAGWLMHGYNGGVPRKAFMDIIKSNGDIFRGDGLRFDKVQYMVHLTIEHRGDDGVLDSITETTFPGSSSQPYILLQDIERVAKGDRLILKSLDVQSESVYQIVAAEDDSGPIYRLMNRPETAHYVDTIKTPANTGRIWNIINFFEFQFVDRPGGIWCVPYRVQ